MMSADLVRCYEEIDQIYDYIRGLAPLPARLRRIKSIDFEQLERDQQRRIQLKQQEQQALRKAQNGLAKVGTTAQAAAASPATAATNETTTKATSEATTATAAAALALKAAAASSNRVRQREPNNADTFAARPRLAAAAAACSTAAAPAPTEGWRQSSNTLHVWSHRPNPVATYQVHSLHRPPQAHSQQQQPLHGIAASNSAAAAAAAARLMNKRNDSRRMTAIGIEEALASVRLAERGLVSQPKAAGAAAAQPASSAVRRVSIRTGYFEPPQLTRAKLIDDDDENDAANSTDGSSAGKSSDSSSQDDSSSDGSSQDEDEEEEDEATSTSRSGETPLPTSHHQASASNRNKPQQVAAAAASKCLAVPNRCLNSISDLHSFSSSSGGQTSSSSSSSSGSSGSTTSASRGDFDASQTTTPAGKATAGNSRKLATAAAAAAQDQARRPRRADDSDLNDGRNDFVSSHSFIKCYYGKERPIANGGAGCTEVQGDSSDESRRDKRQPQSQREIQQQQQPAPSVATKNSKRKLLNLIGLSAKSLGGGGGGGGGGAETTTTKTNDTSQKQSSSSRSQQRAAAAAAAAVAAQQQQPQQFAPPSQTPSGAILSAGSGRVRASAASLSSSNQQRRQRVMTSPIAAMFVAAAQLQPRPALKCSRAAAAANSAGGSSNPAASLFSRRAEMTANYHRSLPFARANEQQQQPLSLPRPDYNQQQQHPLIRHYQHPEVRVARVPSFNAIEGARPSGCHAADSRPAHASGSLAKQLAATRLNQRFSGSLAAFRNFDDSISSASTTASYEAALKRSRERNYHQQQHLNPSPGSRQRVLAQSEPSHNSTRVKLRAERRKPAPAPPATSSTTSSQLIKVPKLSKQSYLLNRPLPKPPGQPEALQARRAPTARKQPTSGVYSSIVAAAATPALSAAASPSRAGQLLASTDLDSMAAASQQQQRLASLPSSVRSLKSSSSSSGAGRRQSQPSTGNGISGNSSSNNNSPLASYPTTSSGISSRLATATATAPTVAIEHSTSASSPPAIINQRVKSLSELHKQRQQRQSIEFKQLSLFPSIGDSICKQSAADFALMDDSDDRELLASSPDQDADRLALVASQSQQQQHHHQQQQQQQLRGQRQLANGRHRRQSPSVGSSKSSSSASNSARSNSTSAGSSGSSLSASRCRLRHQQPAAGQATLERAAPPSGEGAKQQQQQQQLTSSLRLFDERFSSRFLADQQLASSSDSLLESINFSGTLGSRRQRVRIEETEFRKRSDILHVDEPEQQQQQQCFAQCSERRLVNIELNTDSQIHGKMVLLALTKGLPSAHLLEENASLRCQTETSWFYSNFEQPPPELDGSSQPANGSKLRHYSMLKSNHLASMQIQSLKIQWNHQLRREIISIDVNPTRARKNQRIYRNETLLVSELACRSSSDASSIAWTGKINLLALINRELRAVARGSPLLKLSPPKVMTELPRKTATGGEGDKSTLAAEQTSKPAAADDDEGDRNLDSVMNIDRRIEIGPQPMQTHPFNYTQSHTMMDRVGNGGGHLTPPPPPAASNKWLELGGGFHLQEGLGESIRMRLKSNSFLLFTVSSSFVILAYTLCLIIYLKSRRRPFRPNHRLQPIGASKPVVKVAPLAAGRINQATSKSSSGGGGGGGNEEQTMSISEPFNLQMSDATRTRLEMMLKSNRKRKGRACQHPSNAMSQHLIATDQQWWSLSPRKQRRQRDVNRLEFESFGKPPPPPPSMVVGQASPDEHGIYGRGVDCSPAIHFGYSTLDVVRAIRQAASVARFRLRNSRYEPNLNVIHESDLEHLQYASTMGACHPLSGPLMMDGRHEQQQQQQPVTMADCEQAIDDPVVQDALSLECSHFIERNHSRHQTPNATLFSRPIEQRDHGGSPPREQVSRSGILKLVKQDSTQFE